MFRQASLFVGTIVLIAGINCPSSLCKAADDVKSTTTKGPAKQEPAEFEQFDIDDLKGPSPAEPAVAAVKEKEAQEKTEQNRKILDSKPGDLRLPPRPVCDLRS